MKLLVPFITLFLASCGVHNHRYNAEDTYYQDDYYAYGDYDPYYGYGSSEYSTAGDGVYYSNYDNSYNFYPDRWGINYSNVYYSPYRYPRVGFYFSSARNCHHTYSYWSSWCSSPSYWSGFRFGSGYYTSNWWPSWGFGLGYSSFYYDNYWWYNHWRNRTYDHYRPTQRGYYSARNEARRLTQGRHSQRYKGNTSRRHTYQRNNPNAVSRSRSSHNRSSSTRSASRSGSRSVNRNTNRSRNSARGAHSRQQSAALNRNTSNYREITGNRSSRAEDRSTNTALQQRLQRQYAERNIKQPSNNYQKPATNNRQPVASQIRSRNTQTRVKPMNSQSPVYHTNTKPMVQQQRRAQSVSQKPQMVQRSSGTRTSVQRTTQVVPNRTASNSQRSAQRSQSVVRNTTRQASKPARSNRSKSQSKSSNNRSSSNKSSRGSKARVSSRSNDRGRQR